LTLFDSVKSRFKEFGPLYGWLVQVFSPVYSKSEVQQFLRGHASSHSKVLNLGSGTSRIGQNVINVDSHPYRQVDVVCDIANLPFEDDSVDIVCNVAVLEHVPNPEQVVAEIRRVLKPGGLVYCFFPFIQGFHAAPGDFSRRTVEGMKVLYGDFDLVEVKPSGGPTSGMLWIVQEWVAILLSFGHQGLHDAILIVLMLVTFPIKYLDIFLTNHPSASNISSGFALVAKKPSTPKVSPLSFQGD
jgi:SAM-dependent methyltransferase